MSVFYNTTHEDGQLLMHFTDVSKALNTEVLGVFEASPDKSFTPYEVGDALNNKMLASSVKRSITDLTTLGHLIKTDEKVIERYGRPNYKWKLKI